MENPGQEVKESTLVIDMLIDLYPVCAEVLVNFGMACVGCVFSRFHTLEDAAAIYQLDYDQILAALHDPLGGSPPLMSK